MQVVNELYFDKHSPEDVSFLLLPAPGLSFLLNNPQSPAKRSTCEWPTFPVHTLLQGLASQALGGNHIAIQQLAKCLHVPHTLLHTDME